MRTTFAYLTRPGSFRAEEDPVAAFAVLDHLDLARREVDLAEATGLDALEVDDEVEVGVGVVTPDRPRGTSLSMNPRSR